MIWCVEDDGSIRDIEVYALQSAGLAARGFADGSSFWEAVQRERPDLVVLDIMLPGVDGVELLRRIRERPELSAIPVVMATAKGAEYDKVQSLDLGADYYLTKPFGVMEFLACIRSVLRRCGATFEEEGEKTPAGEPITKADLFALGLSGGSGSAERRKALAKALDLPEHLSPNALLDVLNLLPTREEVAETLRRLAGEIGE